MENEQKPATEDETKNVLVAAEQSRAKSISRADTDNTRTEEEPSRNKSHLICGSIIVLIGLVIIQTTYYLGVLRQDIIINRIRDKLDKLSVLHMKSERFPIFEDSSIGVDQSISFYFFNITNPEEIKNKGKPKLKEIGPFVYTFVTKRVNIVFHTNGTMSFNEVKTYTFDRNASVADEETTEIVTVDVPTVVVAISKAKESGVSNPLGAEPTNETTFSFAKEKNGTLGKLIHLYTGGTGIKDLNKVSLVDYVSELPYWKNNEYNCNRVEGILGTSRPSLDNSTEKKLFAPDLCRSILLEYQKDTDLDGIPLRRFIISESVFKSARYSPENECYDPDKFFGAGVLNFQPCVKTGAPLAISLPHFYRADRSLYLDRVEGLSPDPEKHEFFMEHEPISGVTVRARVKIQLNVVIKGDSYCGLEPWLTNEVTQVFPLLWMETAVTAGEASREKLKKAADLPKLGAKAFRIAMITGCVIILLSIPCFLT